MYYDDHVPPHFHVIYGGREAVFEIDPLRVIRGNLPARAQALTLEWARLHQAELRENWERAHAHLQLSPIAPLD